MNDITGIDGILGKIIDTLGLDVIGAPLRAKADSIKKLSDARINNDIELKNYIINSPDLDIKQKLQLNSMLGVSCKKFIRQMKVLNIALDNMDEKSSRENIDEDWLLDFFDKVSNISNEKIQLVWGKMLAATSSDKNMSSKTLLNALFLMSADDVQDFWNLTRFCISEVGVGGNTMKICSYPIIYFARNVKDYERSKITRLRLNKLSQLGLLEVDYKKEFVFPRKSIRLIYNNKIVELDAEDKIKIGNVIFTYDGFLLYQMTEKIYNNKILYYNIELWKKRGYNVRVNECE